MASPSATPGIETQSLRIEERGLICDASLRPESERVGFFTSLCRCASGTLLCSFTLGAAKHALGSTIVVFRSRDGGRTWLQHPFRFETRRGSTPGSLASSEIVEVVPGRLQLFVTWYDRSDPKRPLFDPVTEGILHNKALTAFSTDEGDSWSEWREIPVADLTAYTGTGPVLRWSDGAIAYPFESLKWFDDPKPAVPGAWCMISRDQGRSFGAPVSMARDPSNRIYYWDQRLCAGQRPGEYVGLYWTHDRERQKDLNVHIRVGTVGPAGCVASPIRATALSGQIAAPLLLRDGRLLAFVVDRSGPCTMKLWLSHDMGVTWPESLLVHLHAEHAALSEAQENVDYARYWEDMGKWSFGHPALLELGDDRLLLAFYAGTPTCMSIHWARVEVQRRPKRHSNQKE